MRHPHLKKIEELSVKTCLLLLLFLLMFACSKKQEPQSIVQISTINALMQGVYDGNTTLAEISKSGDFGIGTFNTLDGEMILREGKFYQVKADGKVYEPNESVKSPFATVTFFNPEIKYKVSTLSFMELKSKIDSLMVSPNLFYAVRLHGMFNSIKTRSVPAQQKPYPPLVEVTANQPEFEAQEISGTLNGFYCPPFVAGVNVPGYHLHFISDDEVFGGHVLEFELKEGVLELDQINNFNLVLPEKGGFLDINLKKDLSEDLEKVEG
jgi:acetolactate decarboxylase